MGEPKNCEKQLIGNHCVSEPIPSLQRYIAIEGPIGVGKSSLARRIAETVGSALLLEKLTFFHDITQTGC